jgi:hypothetical protein
MIMGKMIHISKLYLLVEEGSGKLISLKYRKRSTGEMITLVDWTCTSWHSSGRTLNVMNPVNKEVRKLRRALITHFNGVEVII